MMGRGKEGRAQVCDDGGASRLYQGLDLGRLGHERLGQEFATHGRGEGMQMAQIWGEHQGFLLSMLRRPFDTQQWKERAVCPGDTCGNFQQGSM